MLCFHRLHTPISSFSDVPALNRLPSARKTVVWLSLKSVKRLDEAFPFYSVRRANAQNASTSLLHSLEPNFRPYPWLSHNLKSTLVRGHASPVLCCLLAIFPAIAIFRSFALSELNSNI